MEVKRIFIYVVTSLVLAFFCSIRYCSSEKAPYKSFAKDALLAKKLEYYDYIVIGGGTSGCALAATLSASAKVLLLERGGLPYGNQNITLINGFGSTLADNSPTSASQAFVSTDGVFNHRARVLGGGSALNAGFYSRASTEYIRGVGWDQTLVNESYQWVETKVAFRPPMLAWQSAVKNGLLEVGVSPDHGFTYDHVSGTKIGGSIFDENGRRHTAADLLEYADPSKLTVYLNATAHQIMFLTEEVGVLRPRAYGVFYRDSRGGRHTACLSRKNHNNEIILSAGALGSPQLLMLSGIGPKEHLEDHHIGVVLDHPLVGQGMADNPMNALFIPSPVPVEVSLIETVGVTSSGSFIEAASGNIPMAGPHQMAADFGNLAKKSGIGMNTADNFSTFTAMPEFDAYRNATVQAGVILQKVMGPLSRGNLELQSRDPNENPRLTFNYFQDPIDLQRCVQGMETILNVIRSRSFARFRYPLRPVQYYINMMLSFPVNLRYKSAASMVSMESFCQDTVMTIWHYHGGCQMGRVVDNNYRLLGVDALRVVDGSTLNASPGTNPQATVMMLGRYMGLRIIQDRSRQ